MDINGRTTDALIDSGCSLTLIGENFLQSLSLPLSRDRVRLETIDGGIVHTKGSVSLKSVSVDGVELGVVKAFVLPSLPLGVGLVLGLDVILQFGLTVRRVDDGQVSVMFGGSSPVKSALVAVQERESLSIEDEDFEATLDRGRWTVRWKWNGRSCVQGSTYPKEIIGEEDREAFDKELSSWLEEGIIVPHEKVQHGEIKHYLPFIAVRQTKGSLVKVRPVLDYRLLNKSIQSHPGGATPICAELLRTWRQKGDRCSVMDLRRAYLQVHVDPKLWNFQAVRWKGQDYLLTRLGFGLASAPKIMTKIVEAVIGADERVKSSVTSYIDDLYIDEQKITAAEVRNHFSRMGLVAKPPEQLGSQEVRVLGLRVNEEFNWTRDGELPVIPEDLTRRGVHRIVGTWCGHYPVAGWLRVVSGYIQRQVASESLEWDAPISNDLKQLILEVDQRLRSEGDPVGGNWLVDDSAPMKVWADASAIAIGVTLEVENREIEDAAWMRPKDDPKHINCAELDAVIRGLNMALRWGRRDILIMTDSSTVYGWLQAIIKKTHNVKTRSLSEIVIRRRLDILKDILSDEMMKIDVKWVRSTENKADKLTRIPSKWLLRRGKQNEESVETVTAIDIKKIHDKCHFGIEKTQELARERYGEVPRDLVKEVVHGCQQCSRVDPSSRFLYDHGKIVATEVWDKIAVDLTHVDDRPYLSIIDIFTGYTIWARLNNESGSEVTKQLLKVFSAFGPPNCVLSDNGTVFRGRDYLELLLEWEVKSQLSCAYRSQGNGMVERVHRTIKRSVKRSGKSVEHVVFWHNNTRGIRQLSPYEMFFGMTSRKPGVSSQRSLIDRSLSCEDKQDNDLYAHIERNPFMIGDKVYMRPSTGKCDEEWSGPHVVTDLNSSVSVVVNDDGVSRHISHLRLIPGSRANNHSTMVSDDEATATDVSDGPRKSSRVRHRPVWWTDYEVTV